MGEVRTDKCTVQKLVWKGRQIGTFTFPPVHQEQELSNVSEGQSSKGFKFRGRAH